MLNRRPLGRGLDALIENTVADAASVAAQEGGARIVMAPLSKSCRGRFSRGWSSIPSGSRSWRARSRARA